MLFLKHQALLSNHPGHPVTEATHDLKPPVRYSTCQRTHRVSSRFLKHQALLGNHHGHPVTEAAHDLKPPVRYSTCQRTQHVISEAPSTLR